MEITDAKYQELLGDQQKARTLELENSKLKETAENTKVALKANRDEITSLKTEKETIEASFNTFKTEAEKELAKLEWLDDLKAKAEKWSQHETIKAQERTAKIEEMKTKLGEDFMKANSAFLDWLPEDKVETFLSWNVAALDWGNKTVITWAWAGWMGEGAWTAYKTKLDEAMAKWDVNAAMGLIPAPGTY